MSRLTNNPKENIELIIKLSKECYSDYPLLAELTICQAILESGLQNSPPAKLALIYCNLFGIKPGKLMPSGTAGVVNLTTVEYIKGTKVSVLQPFLYNKNIEDSIAQHRKLFDNLSRYAPLKQAIDFQDIAYKVRNAGYATDPHYPAKLVSIHRKYISS